MVVVRLPKGPLPRLLGPQFLSDQVQTLVMVLSKLKLEEDHRQRECC